MQFYESYARLCKNIGKSPSKVAEEIGLTRYAVSKWKTNGCLPNAKTLQQIADYFNVSVDELLSDTKKEPPITDSPHSSIDDVIISELNMLDEEKKRKALRFIMNLADE